MFIFQRAISIKMKKRATSDSSYVERNDEREQDNLKDLKEQLKHRYVGSEYEKNEQLNSTPLNVDNKELSNIFGFEPSIKAVARDIDLFDFGHFDYRIVENPKCRYSSFTGWHIERSSGTINIEVDLFNLALKKPLLIRAVLIRKNEMYRQYGVDRICEKHKREVNYDSQHQVLQPPPDYKGPWKYGVGGPRNSIIFIIEEKDFKKKIKNIELRSICNSTCVTGDNFVATEASRDLWLVLTLESAEYDVILARRHVEIWPKAVVCERDIMKTERRKPKGGAAQSVLNKKRVNSSCYIKSFVKRKTFGKKGIGIKKQLVKIFNDKRATVWGLLNNTNKLSTNEKMRDQQIYELSGIFESSMELAVIAAQVLSVKKRAFMTEIEAAWCSIYAVKNEAEEQLIKEENDTDGEAKIGLMQDELEILYPIDLSNRDHSPSDREIYEVNTYICLHPFYNSHTYLHALSNPNTYTHIVQS